MDPIRLAISWHLSQNDHMRMIKSDDDFEVNSEDNWDESACLIVRARRGELIEEGACILHCSCFTIILMRSDSNWTRKRPLDINWLNLLSLSLPCPLSLYLLFGLAKVQIQQKWMSHFSSERAQPYDQVTSSYLQWMNGWKIQVAVLQM